tara:strand:- start:495 stop:1139 length:645 start_codon:yes stop_codon:yes gene_type:complete
MKDDLKVSTYSNVNFIDKNMTSIRGNLKCGHNVTIDINSIFEGSNVIGNNVQIQAGCIIKNSKIGNNTVVKPFTSIEDTIIGTHCSIGPYANLRNKNIIKNHVSIGNYVEIKKSNIGDRVKINHLSFIGDALIEEDVTIGAGTITCNHDGKLHQNTTIKKGAYVGSGCKLIAPIILGENSTIGSGSVITMDAPKNKLTISRIEQMTIENWERKK